MTVPPSDDTAAGSPEDAAPSAPEDAAPSAPEDAAPSAPEDATKLAEIVARRRAAVTTLRERGIDPYPPRFRPSDTLSAVHERHAGLAPGSETDDVVTVAGRVVARRELGRLTFLVLREGAVDLQLFCRLADLDDAARALLDLVDVGDWLGATGPVMTTRTGELSVRLVTPTLLGKGLRPLPDKWHGLSDTEQRFRQRELDLVVNADARRVFDVRSRVLQALRAEMLARGFVEVETPMLHPIPGGATARPFVTHHNALGVDLFLRIAPELYLKRLVAGGMLRVFEVNRNFRNEGMSTRHNPEFTMLESYAAYDDYHDVMDLTEALMVRAARDATGRTTVTYQGREVELAPPYRRATLLELVRDAADAPTLAYDTPLADVRALLSRHGVEPDDAWGVGKCVVELYEHLVEPTLWAPTFVLDHPIETSPLARRHRSDPHVTERFELIVVGRELANAFSELTDPADQRARFEAQVAAGAAGDDEAMGLDEPYLRAMELGMPPMGGLGVGVDRLVMLLADVANIRDVILFPTLRPEHHG